MAVLYILLNHEKKTSQLAFNNIKPAFLRTLKPVIGALRFTAGIDSWSGPGDEEWSRINYYLEYSEQLLRYRGVQKNSSGQAANRSNTLNQLHEYILKGEYPGGHDYMGNRKVVHRDSQGRITALGYLVKTSAVPYSKSLIEALEKSASIHEVHHPFWDIWSSGTGLSKTELAML